jgi:uridine kinase
MKGDVLKIKPQHTAAAQAAYALLAEEIKAAPGRFVVTVGGESGSGKSEIAAELARFAAEDGFPSRILQQDDYFRLPPQTNACRRREDFEWVGPGEVRLELLDEHLCLARDPAVAEIEKPLSLFEEDVLASETVSLEGVKLVVVEGTYTASLRHADRRLFLTRDYRATAPARAERGREAQDDFLERVLAREHEFIAPLRERADLLIDDDYSVTAVEQ